MISPGLGRIGRLLQHSPLPWRAVHVAGTNGKGSVCAYASTMLHAAGIKCGRFNSPHLIDRWDCIKIDEVTVGESLFFTVEAEVEARNKSEHIQASEFELLTATAFEIFTREKVDIGVVEVGMGGRLDATNVLQNPFATVISKIGLDHQVFLGNTLEEIASQKAGIFKPQVPCVVDGTNTMGVTEVLKATADCVGATPFIRVPQDTCIEHGPLLHSSRMEDLEKHQQTNLCLAFEAVKQVMSQLRPSAEPAELQYLAHAIRDTAPPGRLQAISIEPITGRAQNILLDGAHNIQSAEVLDSYVSRHIRREGSPVTWVVAFSEGKDIRAILSSLIRQHDNVVAVEFGPVDGMPWVKAASADEILRISRVLGVHGEILIVADNLDDALHAASNVSMGGPLVIAGSLYLASDVLRLLRRHSKQCI